MMKVVADAKLRVGDREGYVRRELGEVTNVRMYSLDDLGQDAPILPFTVGIGKGKVAAPCPLPFHPFT